MKTLLAVLFMLFPAASWAGSPTLGNAAFNSVTLTTPLAPSSGGLGATGLTGYPYLNGNSAATASVNIPASAITGLSGVYAPLASPALTGTPTINGSVISTNTGRTVTGTTDSIVSTDQGGVVVYNNGASAVAVTLPANSSRVATDIVEIGSGLVTITAATGGSLNGVSNGYVVISANVDYHIIMAYNVNGAAANWLIK